MMAPTTARRRHPIDTGGPWGLGLLILGVGAVGQGFSYATSPVGELPATVRAMAQVVPPLVLGAPWVLAGLYCAVKALLPPQQHTDVWPVATMFTTWAVAYFAYWMGHGIAGHGWAQASGSWVGWASLAALTLSWSRCVNPPHLRPLPRDRGRP